MGIIRKTASVFTVGAVDFRSDKERTARYTKQTRDAIREQTQLAEQQAHAAHRQAATAPPAGWYADPHGQPCRRWWDGAQWTGHTQQ